MEVLRFIFSSFWVWLGAVVLVAAAGEAVAGIAKTGFFLAAVIMPYSVINDKFVYQLSELAQQCRRALEVQKMARPAAEPVDETQCRINVDESTGEIIDFPGETEAE